MKDEWDRERPRERLWHPAALELLDRLTLSNTYIGAIRGRMHNVLGWYPTEHEVLWQANRWNRRSSSAPAAEATMAKPPAGGPVRRVGPGGFSMLDRRVR